MIELKDFTFRYSKRQSMFEDFNMKLELGSVYGLLGKNGAGKSTLLKNIIGALHPVKGFCGIDGQQSMQRQPATMEKIYFLPEQIVAPSVTVSQFIKMNGPFYPHFSRDTFYEILQEFDLDTNAPLNKLSHGQQKKVALAFGISTNTDWLLLDEPTNGLDIPSKSSFRKVIGAHITEDRGIIISTHQVSDIENTIEDLVVIDNGKLLLNDSLFEISEKLSFQLFNESVDARTDVLYKESFGLGARAILKNDGEGDSQVDLEILFNALLAKDEAVINHLKK